MSITEKKLEVSHPSSEIDSKALLINVPNVYIENISPWSSLAGLSQKTNPVAEKQNSLHGSYTSLIIEMQTQKAFSKAPSFVQNCFQETTQKQNFLPWFFKVPSEKKKQNFDRSCTFSIES